MVQTFWYLVHLALCCDRPNRLFRSHHRHPIQRFDFSGQTLAVTFLNSKHSSHTLAVMANVRQKKTNSVHVVDVMH